MAQLDAAAWRRLNHLFDAALSLPAAEREAYVNSAASSEPAVRDELLSLLKAYSEEPEFLEQPLYKLTEGFAADTNLQVEQGLPPGTILGDFEVIREVGKGAFARVYKARQISLERVVALKVTASPVKTLTEREARNMAALSHDHIVPVYLLADDAERKLRLVAMPFIEGPTLAKIVSELKTLPSELRNGRAILTIVDQTSGTGAMTYSTVGASFRAHLHHSDLIGASLLIGTALAEALAYAHARGVLHLDVKPANVLLDGYGRPLLSDFNVAIRRGLDSTVLGGTAGYMSPEQMKALRDETASVDPRADVYALGVVTKELVGDAALPNVVAGVLAKATAHNANDRYEDASVMAKALICSRHLLQILNDLPPASHWLKLAIRFPATAILIAAVVPQMIGSAINIVYNSIQIAGDLTEDQQELFQMLVGIYNLVVYPAAVLLVWRPLQRVRAHTRRQDILTMPETELARLRRDVLTPLRALVFATSLGWLPGAILFPAVLDYITGDVGAAVYGHFVLSFVSSYLVALTYSYLILAQIIVRGIYPRFFAAETPVAAAARRELMPQLRRLKWLQLAAGLIPLAGAAMIVSTGTVLSPTQHRIFQVLVLALIAAAMAGYTFAMRITDQIKKTITVLTAEPTN